MRGAGVLVYLFSALHLAPYSFARIGESIQECTERYGEPQSKLAQTSVHRSAFQLQFRKAGVFVWVTFYSNFAVEIAFSKVDGSDFSEAEVETLLDRNKHSTAWLKRKSPKKGVSEWQTGDGERIARLGPNQEGEEGGKLTIWISEWGEMAKTDDPEERRRIAESKFEGF